MTKIWVITMEARDNDGFITAPPEMIVAYTDHAKAEQKVVKLMEAREDTIYSYYVNEVDMED